MTTKRAEHISEKGKKVTAIKESEIIDISDLCLHNQDALVLALDHCIKCNTCKYAFRQFTPSCPSGEEFLWESYWASGRIRLARALLAGDLKFDDSIIQPIFACITCGSCQDQCQAVHHNQIVDIFEALRELAVKRIGPTEKHKKLDILVQKNYNPYGESHSTNQELKARLNLPDKADVVYFIGCTSNYRQQELRDATLSVFKKLGITFTIIDEYCCGSPLIRTGQLNQIDSLMKHNIEQIKQAGAKTVVTSCAGCYRTLKKDFKKFGNPLDVRVLHTTEFLLPRLSKGMMKAINSASNTIVTYHDPCHLGHHLGYFEIPRQIIGLIPGIELKEMERNKKAAWCCGAGGGVKIGYPELSLKTSEKRIQEASNTGAQLLLSICPFCKTNLTDGCKNLQSKLQVMDLIQLLDQVL